MDGTHSGKLPMHLATYSLRTTPAIISSVRSRAVAAVVAMNMHPEVSRSNRLTAKLSVNER